MGGGGYFLDHRGRLQVTEIRFASKYVMLLKKRLKCLEKISRLTTERWLKECSFVKRLDLNYETEREERGQFFDQKIDLGLKAAVALVWPKIIQH